MSISKLNTESDVTHTAPLSVGLSFQHDLYGLADTVLKTRAMRALEHGAARYPIYRLERCAARRKLMSVFDDLALHMGLTALRLDEGSLLLDGPDVFVSAEGKRKTDYCSCEFEIWSESVVRAEAVREKLLKLVGDRIGRDQMFTIDWNFMNGRSGLVNTSFDEIASEPPMDEAYPSLGMPIAEFSERFLNANETILMLQGSPGTGKTRLVRAILGQMSRRKNETAKVMYTSDKKALENDEIFVDFITGSHDAFVIEDADHLLLARSNGNHDLHRFLAIADGVVRAQGRKIIFTTNLPNVNDIDEALLRPGRCFANVRTRSLSREEAEKLLAKIAVDPELQSMTLAALFAGGAKSASLANIYQQLDRCRLKLAN